MIRYTYNAQVQPPAPFVYLTLRNPADGSEVQNVAAQIDNEPWVLLGRDVVNAHRLVLDGPQFTLEIG